MRYKRFFFITSNTIKWLIQVFVVFFRFRINNLPILFMYGLVYINFLGVCIILNLVSAFLVSWMPVRLSGFSSIKR